MSGLRRTVFTIITLGCLLLASLPTATALPTPGLFGEPAEQATGRLFPEALETNDYVGYFEAMDILRLMEERYPGWVTLKVVGESYGLTDLTTQQMVHHEIPLVEVTNPDSPVAYEDKIQILFMLSIHGNEKGGREGGLRIIEDFAKDIGMSAWTNQNGAGNGTYRDYLDFMTLLFLFPNADGWAHDEPQYLLSTIDPDPNNLGPFSTTGCANGVIFYCRTNGANVDLNREVPTQGWVRESYTPLSEPESNGFANYLRENYHNLAGATDIHGMPQDDKFVLTMMPAAQMDPHEMIQSTRLAEMLKERLNNDPHFDVYHNSPYAPGAWGGQFNEWGTVWDAIGYTDSGFNGDYFAQDTGLDVPGFDIELAYNHITFDSQYELGMYFNDYHIQATRQIVAVFMDGLAQDLKTSIETHGTRTAVLSNPVVVTNVDDAKPLDGWAAETPNDDAWDYAHKDFFAAADNYWVQLKPYLKDGDEPGVLDRINRVELTASNLARYDNLVIPGSALQQIDNDTAKAQIILDWVEAGGTLVLTDGALRFLEQADLAEQGSVRQELLYAGYTNFIDRSHPLVSNVRGIARQTYEPVPLGFSITANSSPNWVVDANQMKTASKLDAMGWVTDENQTNLGQFEHGEGTIRYLGSLLPDPSEEFYHPYGLASYATTYSGNQLLRNLLGWEQVFEAPPAVLTDQGIVYTPPQSTTLSDDATSAPADSAEESPGLALSASMVALLVAAVLLARRRRL